MITISKAMAANGASASENVLLGSWLVIVSAVVAGFIGFEACSIHIPL